MREAGLTTQESRAVRLAYLILERRRTGKLPDRRAYMDTFGVDRTTAWRDMVAVEKLDFVLSEIQKIEERVALGTD